MDKGIPEVIERLHPSQIDVLLSSVKHERDQLLLRVLYETGCTVAEVTSIKRVHIDPERNAISFFSTHHPRTACISSSLGTRLLEYMAVLGNDELGNDDFLFSGRQSGRLTARRVRQIVEHYSEMILGRMVTPHVLRYTHIAHALEKGLPLHAIQSQVGLDDLRMAQIARQLNVAHHDNYARFFH